jgi:hypothetical protein
MTRNSFCQAVEALAAIARVHQQTTPAHLPRDCAFCQSLDDRRDELVRRWVRPLSVR